jgi:hypothetical protein
MGCDCVLIGSEPPRFISKTPVLSQFLEVIRIFPFGQAAGDVFEFSPKRVLEKFDSGIGFLLFPSYVVNTLRESTYYESDVVRSDHRPNHQTYPSGNVVEGSQANHQENEGVVEPSL